MGYLYQARDGVGPRIKEDPQIRMWPQSQEKYPYVSLKMENKTSKLIARGYSMEGVILTLTSFFYVPNVEDDIHMVFDTTVSGINDFLWAKNFILQSIGCLLMIVDVETHMVDLEFGEMFYNFRLSSLLANYLGVDLGSYLRHKKYQKGRSLWMRWVRFMMVLVFSPYANIQGLLQESEVVRGNRSEPNNPLRWDKIRLNLHRDTNYPPTIPQIQFF